MLSLHEKLSNLSQQLQNINLRSTNQEDITKAGNYHGGSTKFQYICAECAWTTSISARALAHHFLLKHTAHLKCPDCRTLCRNRETLEKHQSKMHRHLCPACQRYFATVTECGHHEPCASQYSIILESVVSPTTVTHQSVGETIPSLAPSSIDKRGSLQSGSCPDPDCQLTFSDFDQLYEHYVASHPLFVLHQDPSKPFKCPFCSKRYQHHRFILGHIKRHKPKPLIDYGTGGVEHQESLIQQSRIAMASRELESRTQVQAQTSRVSVDMEDEEDYYLVVKGGLIYMNEGVEEKDRFLESRGQNDMRESQPPWMANQIGLVLQACPADPPAPHTSNKESMMEFALQIPAAEDGFPDSMDLEHDYPERFALDDDDLRSTTIHGGSSIIATRVLDRIFIWILSCEIVRTLGMQHFISHGEVLRLLTYFLDDYQRNYILQQLGSIELNQNDPVILAALQGTVFRDLIDAWIDFKRLAIHFAPQSIRQASDHGMDLGKAFTSALLWYCLNLENTIYQNQSHIAYKRLLGPSVDDLVLDTNVSFPRLVAALAKRVQIGVLYDTSVVFTNEMVLRGMTDYIRKMQTTFRLMYPESAGHETLWKELQIVSEVKPSLPLKMPKPYAQYAQLQI